MSDSGTGSERSREIVAESAGPRPAVGIQRIFDETNPILVAAHKQKTPARGPAVLVSG